MMATEHKRSLAMDKCDETGDLIHSGIAALLPTASDGKVMRSVVSVHLSVHFHSFFEQVNLSP